MIKNIVFDIGNVLVKFGWEEYFEKNGLTGETFERVANATVHSKVWTETDRGVLSEEELLNLFIANDPGVEAEIRKVFASIAIMLTQYDYTKGWIIDLQKRGYKVYCLSNMSHKAVRECAKALDFLPMLDGYILSCDVQVVKPEDAIYNALFDRYGLKPEECIFFDDLERNIKRANELKMHGVVFTGVKEAEEAIERITKEQAGEFKSSYSKRQRIAAIVCLAIIAALYLTTFILTLINTEAAAKMLRVSLGLTLGLPILAWVFIWLIGKLTGKHTIADFDFFEDRK